MTDLTTLFNQSPGCDLAGNTHPFDGSCAIPYLDTAGTAPNQPGEDGSQAAKENPYNDTSVQLPAVGSGQGVKELYTALSTPEAYARASSNLASAIHATSAQNVISWGIDGVTGVHFVAGGTGLGATAVQMPTNSVTGLTLTQLQNVYSGGVSCANGGGPGTTYKMVWYCLDPTATNATALKTLPIDCYMAQTGSGTEGTWKQFVTLGSDTPACLNNEYRGPAGAPGSRCAGNATAPLSCGTPTQQTAANLSHIGLFENEVSSIVNPGAWYNADIPQTLYFYSFGKYESQCTSSTAVAPQTVAANYTAFCPGTTVGANKYKTALLKVNNIVASKATIQGNGGGIPGNFPIIRYLANVYNNTSVGTNGIVSAAALNFIGEEGFLCKPQTATDIDPLTGVNYRTEIEAAITANGFFPIDKAPIHTTPGTGPFSEGLLATPGSLGVDPNYTFVDPSFAHNNQPGYCLATNG